MAKPETHSSKPSKRRSGGSKIPVSHLEPVDFRTLAEDIDGQDHWLVEPLIPARRSTAIVAKGGVGKSLIMLEISAALATGRRTLMRTAGSPISVLYIDMEMTPEDLAERLTDFGYDFTKNKRLRKNLHYYQLQSFKPFDTISGGKELLAVVKRHDADLVVIDTLAGVVQGNENDADTYRAFAARTGKLLKAAGVTVVRLDHEGKSAGKGARGSSAKRDDVDVVWRMSAYTGSQKGFKFLRDKTRARWVPGRVDLKRTSEEPLEHEIKNEKLTERASALIDELDRLDLPDNVGRPLAQKALKEAKIPSSTDDLVLAIAERKRRGGQAGGQVP